MFPAAGGSPQEMPSGVLYHWFCLECNYCLSTGPLEPTELERTRVERVLKRWQAPSSVTGPLSIQETQHSVCTKLWEMLNVSLHHPCCLLSIT